MTLREDALSFEIENRYPLLWPVSAVFKGGRVTLTTYCELEGKLSFIEGMSERELFDRDTIDRIIGVLEVELEKHGYEIIYGKNYIYKINKREDVNKSLILDSSEVLVPECDYESLIDIQPEQLEMGCLVFATVLDGTIVSLAGENPYREDESIVDIGVETADGYTGKGYGASNVAALTYYLLDTGMTVSYTVDDENDVSVRLAERVGFIRDGHVLNIMAQKCDQSNEQE